MTDEERKKLANELDELANEILHLPERFPHDEEPDIVARTAANMVMHKARSLRKECK